jgi:hypothetical protein
MIYNRTQTDIETAKNLIETKVKTFQPLTESEIEKIERGTLTINTLNRIENKQGELRELLNAAGYWYTNISSRSREWEYTDIFVEEDFARILKNCQILKNAFLQYFDTPKTPKVAYHFENINSIEKILFDLEKMVNEIKSNYRQCGAFECGGDNQQ